MLTATQITKSYRRGPSAVAVLTQLDLTISRGEFLAIVGASGSGKSTLIHLLGTLDAPDSGQIHLDGRRIDQLKGVERDRLRNQTFGYVFQFYHLLPELNTLQNVLIPATIAESVWSWFRTKKAWHKRADQLLERVGLSHRLTHKPRELSGGELQRAAVARALMTNPRILFADEPTGNLDVASGSAIIDLLQSLHRDENMTIVMVTHNLELTSLADRVVQMAHGRLVKPEPTYALSAG